MTKKKDENGTDTGTYDKAPEPSAAEITRLKAENAALKAEVEKLKGEPDYVPQPYPKMLQDGRIVQDEEEHKRIFPHDWKAHQLV